MRLTPPIEYFSINFRNISFIATVQQLGHIPVEPVRDAPVLEQCSRVLSQVGRPQCDDVLGLPLHRPQLCAALRLRLGLLRQLGRARHHTRARLAMDRGRIQYFPGLHFR